MKTLKIFSMMFIATAMMCLMAGCDDNDDIMDEEQTTDEPVPNEPKDEPEGGEEDNGIVKILCIGNSFSSDAVEQNLYALFDEVGIESVIGNLYYEDCSLEQHYEFAMANSSRYSYRKVVRGVKTTNENTKMLEGILDEDWDYISFQQYSPLSGVYETYNPYLPSLIQYVSGNATNKNVKFIFHQTWAYSYDYSSSEYENYYDSDQLTMYYAINEAAQKAVADNGMEILVPSGTAVQNARASYLGDTLNSDGQQLETTYGRFTAACAWFEAISGIDVTTTSYTPSGVTSDAREVAVNAAHFAVQNPYEINSMSAWEIDPDLPAGVSSSVDELSFTRTGGSETITITSNSKWSATAPDWVTVKPSSGSAGKNQNVTLTAVANTELGSETRTGKVTFALDSGEGDSATITITQAGNDSNEWFFDDLDWLIPYAESVDQADCVGNHRQTGYVQTDARLDNVTVNGKSAMDELHERGYLIERYDGKVSTSGSNVYTFAMPGYLYFGNSSNTSGLHLPAISAIPVGYSLFINFDWCPGMNTGSPYAVDNVAPMVVVTNGSTVSSFSCEGHSFSDGYYEWISVTLELGTVTNDEDIEIFIRPQDSYWANPDRARWFIDNISVYSPKE